ncbi:MAG: LptA/OstA family protein [Gammaproteobacteria bacterium]
MTFALLAMWAKRITCALVLAAGGLALAAQGAEEAEDRRVNIASDSAVYGAGGDDVVFAGNVAATIGVWHLSAATLQVRGGQYFAYGNPLRASGTTASGGTVVVNAGYLTYDGIGKVRISGAGEKPVSAGWLAADGDITVRALTITYDLDSGDALLTGDALLGRGAEQITGSRISVNVNTGAMKAEQGRVRAVLDSDK